MPAIVHRFLRFLKRIFYVLDTHLLWRFSPQLRNRLWQKGQRIYRFLQSEQKEKPSSSSLFSKQTLPPKALSELQKIGTFIEPTLHPEGPNFPFFEKLVAFSRPHAGHQYAKAISTLSPPYTHCFILPWLKRGGGDLVALHHIRAACQRKGSRVLVILTEPGDSPWLSQVPSEAQVLNLAPYLHTLNPHESETLLVRLLLQMAPQRIHVIYSDLGWSVLSQYGQALSQQSRLHVSLFCDTKTRSGGLMGEAYQFFPQCAAHIDRVLSDNSAFPKKLMDMYGFSPDLFQTLYSPVFIPENLPARSPTLPHQVLWASRMDQQKRPDLLAHIAQHLPDVTFLVFGAPIFKQEGEALHLLKRLKNVKLKGAYEDFASLPTQACTLFLYTSEWDGLPNVLLEAAAHGLPIIASDVGGVSEFITPDTGYLVSPFNDVKKYVQAIQQALNTPLEAQKRAENALKLLKERHSWEAFVQQSTEADL